MEINELDSIYKNICQNKDLSIDSLPPVILPSDGKLPETEIMVTDAGILVPKHVEFWRKWPVQNEDSMFFVNFFYYNTSYSEKLFASIRFDDEDDNYKIWVEDFTSDRYFKSFSLDLTDPSICPVEIVNTISDLWKEFGSYDFMVYNQLVPRVEIECFNYTIQVEDKIMTIVDFGECLKFSRILRDIFFQIAMLYIKSSCKGYLYNFRDYFSSLKNGLFLEDDISMDSIWPKQIEEI